MRSTSLAILLAASSAATSVACSRHTTPNDPPDPAGGAARSTSSAASEKAGAQLRPAWTGATTLRNPPVKLAEGVTGIVAHVPEGYDASKPIHLVLFFHGSGSCALQLASAGDVVCKPGEGSPMAGAALDARHDDAGTQSIFAVPQFVLWGGGTAGRLMEKGYFTSFVRELVEETFAPGLGGPRTLDDVASITLVAHSAGYIPVVAILQRGELRDKVRNVVLIDSLFGGGVDTYANWLAQPPLASPRRFAAVYGKWGSNNANGRALAARVERRSPGVTAVDPPGSFEQAIRDHAVTVKLWADMEHGWMPLLVLTKVVAALDLPRRPIVPTRTPLPGRLQPPAPLVLGQEQSGSLDERDSPLENGAVADDYRIDLPAGVPVVVEVRGGPSVTEPCCSLDVFTQLLSDTKVLAADDDGGGFFDSQIPFTPPTAGPYLVRVTTQGSGQKRGPYTVVVKSAPGYL